VGAGSWRNFSFTDLLLRQGNTDTANLSAANLGVIKVKGPWQLSLPNNVDLADVLNDTRYFGNVLEAVQQVCTPCKCRLLLNTGMLCSF